MIKKRLAFLYCFFICTLFSFYSFAQLTTYAGGYGENLSASVYGRVDANQILVDPGGNIYYATLYGYVRKIDAATHILTSIAGNGTVNASYGSPAVLSPLSSPTAIAMDPSGAIYITVRDNHSIAKIDAAGNLVRVVGIGYGGYSGDGSFATTAQLYFPQSIAFDHVGNLYVADAGNNRIRKITPAGIISTVVGTGVAAFTGDGAVATAAGISDPRGIVFDAADNMYFAEIGNSRVRKVSTSGILTTVAGGGFSAADGISALSANIKPIDVCFDGSGNLYIADSYNNKVRKVSPTGIITTVAGTGTSGYTGDGGSATVAQISEPNSVKFYGGELYVSTNGRIRIVSSSGIINTFAGNGLPTSGFGGDGGNACLGVFTGIDCIGADRAGNIYISGNNRIRKVNADGILSTFAGNGVSGYLGDGGPATSASIIWPTAICSDRMGNIYVADNGSHHIRKISTSGIISTVAGGGALLGDGGLATAASIYPVGVAVDSQLNVYISDRNNQRIRKVDALTGVISTIAGNGISTFSGDGGPASLASVNNPGEIVVDQSGNIYFLDVNAARVRKISTDGLIKTVAGGGGSVDEGIIATSASLIAERLAIDKQNNLYIAANIDASIRRIDHYGYIRTIVGDGTKGHIDYPNPLKGEIFSVNGMSLDTVGNLFVGESNPAAPCVRKVCCLDGLIDRPPLFVHASPQSLNICASAPAVSIDTFLSITDADSGDPLTYTIKSGPTHGALSGFPFTSSSTGSIVTPSGLQYTPTPGYSGGDNFTIQVTDGIDISTITISVSITPLPTASISGATSVCATDSIILSGYTAGGIWSTTNGNAAINPSGKLYGIVAGLDTVLYSTANSCGSATARSVIAVNPLAVSGAITGPAVVCEGSSITLSNATTGGVWSTSSPYASITPGGGIVIGFAPGTATITYTATNMCGTSSTTANITVSSATWPGTLSGAPTLCSGASTTISSTVTGGTWSSSTPSVATIGSISGIVTGAAPGAAIISYTVNGACGSGTVITIVNVTSATPIDPITGASSICTGTNTTLTNASAGGTWSSSAPSIASVNSAGVVTGNAAGIAMISYTASLGCGVSVATFNIVVNNTPIVGALSGPATLCEGANALMSSTVAGGSWSAGGSHATISTSGILTGVSAGTEIITYTITNSCGSVTGTYTVNVFAVPFAGTLSGASALCAGATTALTGTAAGGAWSSSNGAVASVGATGVVSGITGGVVNISYTATTGCGTAVATHTVTVNAPSAGTISGITSVCAGGSATLVSTVPGGTWSSNATAVASINSSGVVSALAGGAAVISYAVSTACGTDVSTVIFTVGSLPVVSNITGATSVCAGSHTTFTDATIGGVWSSSNVTVATINSSGVVTGVTGGTTTISYMVTAGCGTAGSTFVLTVNAIPSVPIISGTVTVCESGMTTLSASATGGAWSSSNSAVASVAAGTGVVTGVTAGTATITYVILNVCGSSLNMRVVTVNPLPYAGAIFGPSHVCAGATLTLSTTVGGGTWSSSDIAVANAGSSTGVISGMSEGTATISYSRLNSCGTAAATAALTVDPIPVVSAILGTDTICAGTATLFTNATGGGIWGSTAPGIASVSASGAVTGNSAGTATVYYALTTACGTATSAKVIAINSTNAGTITGLMGICEGGTTTLSNSAPGGIWTSSLGAVATISSGGIVSALSPGSTIISYTVTDACGVATATTLFTVGTLPNVSPIAGTNTICRGSATTLTNPTAGGSWSSGNTTVATVSGSGTVTGVAGGTAIISYSVTAGCGTASSIFEMHIEDMPSAGAITGETYVCKGAQTLLSASVAGGTWRSTDISIAAVDNDGYVTGVSTGPVVISYSVSNTCGTSLVTQLIAVITTPDPGFIAGNVNVCAGNTTDLGASEPVGAWHSGNTSVATVANGVVTGQNVGTATISYAVTNRCGSGYVLAVVNVNALPHVMPIEGPTTVEVGHRITLSEAVAGGTWSVSDAPIATIDNSGIVLGSAVGPTVVSYTIINSEGCTAVATKAIDVQELNSGIHGTFAIYPNPAKNTLTISWENQYATYADVAITDMLGQIMETGFINMPQHKGTTELNVQNLVPGTYMINIKYAGDFFCSKLVIVK